MEQTMLERFRDSLICHGASKNTIENYLRNVGLYIKWHEQSTGVPFDGRVTEFDAREYKSYLNTILKQAPATINAKLTAIQKFADFLCESGSQDAVKVAKQRMVKIPDVKVLDRSSLYKCRRWVHAYGSKRDIAIFEVLLNAGLRESELAYAELPDLYLSDRKGRLVIRHGKGGKIRTVPLNADARKALSEYLQVRQADGENRIFVGQCGPIGRSGIYKIIVKIGHQGAGVELWPHMLRHQCFTAMANAGVDLGTIAAIAGHDDPKTTNTYYVAHSNEKQEDAINNLHF